MDFLEILDFLGFHFKYLRNTWGISKIHAEEPRDNNEVKGCPEEQGEVMFKEWGWSNSTAVLALYMVTGFNVWHPTWSLEPTRL